MKLLVSLALAASRSKDLAEVYHSLGKEIASWVEKLSDEQAELGDTKLTPLEKIVRALDALA